MKFLLTFLSVVAVSATNHLPIFGKNHKVPLSDVEVDSTLGRNLMANARRLDENAASFTWISGFSMKFQGCHHISQWNNNVDNAEDVRIETKRLIRFRLCPTSSCTASNAAGCNKGYGDYVIDMDTYLSYYVKSLEDYNDYLCAAVTCDCSNADDQDTCYYECYNKKGLDVICGIKNPNGNNKNNFKIEEYMNCGQYKFNRRRELAESDALEILDRELADNKYYLGPYCAEQGGAVFLGLFTDDSCTTFADDAGGATTFYENSLTDLPYAKTSIINMECYDCLEASDYVEGNDANDADTVKETCENIYPIAGKCETLLSIANPNNVACNYMEGIKITRKDGTIQASKSANTTASVFIGLFVVSFLLLAAYVYYLKTKLDRASISLSE